MLLVGGYFMQYHCIFYCSKVAYNFRFSYNIRVNKWLHNLQFERMHFVPVSKDFVVSSSYAIILLK